MFPSQSLKSQPCIYENIPIFPHDIVAPMILQTMCSITFLLSGYFSATMSKADHDKMSAVESEDPSDGYVNQG